VVVEEVVASLEAAVVGVVVAVSWLMMRMRTGSSKEEVSR